VLLLELRGQEDFTPQRMIDTSQLVSLDAVGRAGGDAVDDEERARRARTVVVPTSDAAVRNALRRLGEPVTAFGEIAVDRRERLRSFLSDNPDAAPVAAPVPAAMVPPVRVKEFFHEGSARLVAARGELCAASLAAARRRLGTHKTEFAVNVAVRRERRAAANAAWGRSECVKVVTAPAATGAGLLADRGLPFTSVASFTHCDTLRQTLVMGSDDRSVTAWHCGSGALTAVGTGHTQRVNDVATQKTAAARFASCGNDGDARVWTLCHDEDSDGASISSDAVLSGDGGRVNRVRWCPTASNLLATTSADCAARLWDVTHAEEPLVVQEGHTRAAHGLAFHCDGSLLASSDMSGAVLVWDLRSGKLVMRPPVGHSGPCTAIDFSPNGVTMATGGGDGVVRCWDLRSLTQSSAPSPLFTVAAHSDYVSCLQHVSSAGVDVPVIATGGLDGTVATWDAASGAACSRTTVGFAAVRGIAFSFGGDVEQCPLPDMVAVSHEPLWRSWSPDMSAVSADAVQRTRLDITTSVAAPTRIGAAAAAATAGAAPATTADAASDSDSDDDLAGMRA
jgi:U4/U6 small nuclear ribonucleoprotein PRP4